MMRGDAISFVYNVLPSFPSEIELSYHTSAGLSLINKRFSNLF